MEWFRVMDPSTGLTHHAYRHPEYEDHYVTECNILFTVLHKSAHAPKDTSWTILEQHEELTCDECLEWLSMGPLDDDQTYDT